MHTAILAMLVLSLALYAVGVIVARSYDSAAELVGIALAWCGVGLFALTGLLSVAYLTLYLLT